MPARLLIFDDLCGSFGPLTDRRAAFGMRSGVLNNRVRIEATLGLMATDLVVDESLVEAYRGRETDARVNQPLRRDQAIEFHFSQDGRGWSPVEVPGDCDVLLVNGRWTGASHDTARAVRDLTAGRALVDTNGVVIAARLSVDEAQLFVSDGCVTLFGGSSADTLGNVALLSRPWHILDQLEATLAFDLAWLNARIAPSAAVHPSAVIIQEKGPVAIDAHATVQPLAVLEGPCSVGTHSIIAAHTHVRPNTVIGSRCKIGGEVSNSIVDDCTNKAHAGYLGHSLVGQWCNLGAGTTVSNLKNTYGRVRADLGDGSQDTGRTFLGPVLGDFVHTAIGTRILTGSVVGTGVCLAASAFAPKHVPAFRFITDAGDVSYDIERFLISVRAAMARRDMSLNDAEEALLRRLHSHV